MKWVFLKTVVEERGDITEESEMDPERIIQLSKYHKWDYISSPHLLLGENRVQENQEFFTD